MVNKKNEMGVNVIFKILEHYVSHKDTECLTIKRWKKDILRNSN